MTPEPFVRRFENPAARVLLVTCLAMLVWAGCADSGDPDTESTRPTTTSIRVDDAAPPSSAALPAAPSTEGAPPAERLTRPIIDPDLCESFTASGDATEQRPLNPGGSPLTLFARPSAQPVPILVLADPVDGPTGPFALIERLFDQGDTRRSADSVTIDGTEFFVRSLNNDHGEVTWWLDDGSQGYLRSRGFGRDDLVELVSALSPRPIDAPVPGFDYVGGSGEIEVVIDQLNTDLVSGSFARSQCRVANSDNLYKISVATGDPLYHYVVVIDRPPPIDVARLDGSLVVVEGANGPDAPTAETIRNADTETWQELLSSASPPSES